MSKKLLISVLVIIILLGGWYFLFGNKGGQTGFKNQETIIEENNSAIPEGIMMEDGIVEADLGVVSVTDVDKVGQGSYEIYSPEKNILAEGGKVILFFKASWCPTCRALDADIKANSQNIPEGVFILEVDYDSYSDLKKKYGVTYQHTLVQVDAAGNQVKKWSNSPTLASLLTNIK